MAAKNQSIKRLLNSLDFSSRLLRKEEYYRIAYNVVNRCQWSSKSEKAERNELKNPNEAQKPPLKSNSNSNYEGGFISKYSSSDEDDSIKWKPELAWLSKALEPALQLLKRALPTGNGIGDRPPPIDRSLSEIFASIQRSKIGLQDWSLSDLTIGLYLIYLQQASTGVTEDIKGKQIFSESTIHDLIYHLELAKGAYKENTRILAKISMLRESNVVKFVKNSSVLRPGYYIAVDKRKKLVILGIRGTHTVYDLITDVVSSSHEEVTFEGYSTHFGTAESARWFLRHEMDTIRKCLDKHEVLRNLTLCWCSICILISFYSRQIIVFGRLTHPQGFRLRLVGHSLGGATASLLATMLRQKSIKELGFSPEIVSAVGYATPPCVSKELAENCSDYVTTVVMQDDIIPRLSVASLTRLRNEVLQTDWVSVFEKEDWKRVVDLVTNAKQVVSTVQDVGRKLADYANFRSQSRFPEIPSKAEVPSAPSVPSTSTSAVSPSTLVKKEETSCSMPEELFIPGTLYYLKRNMVHGEEFFTLLKRHPGEHFQRILLSSNLISDHKCDSHIYALRDVLKGLPGPSEESIFR